MAVNRRIFTDEFKAEAVRLVTVEGHAARQVARDLDIHESLLRRWQPYLVLRPRYLVPNKHPRLAVRSGSRVSLDTAVGLNPP
jgi:transposase-like protein